jgi:hypothetical protein
LHQDPGEKRYTFYLRTKELNQDKGFINQPFNDFTLQ